MEEAEDGARDRIDPILHYLHGRYPDLDFTAKAVTMRLRRAAHFTDTQVKRRLPDGMESWELEPLATLLRRGGRVGISELQDAAQVTAGAISNRIGRLEKNGFVIRTIDSTDRRQVHVTLTEAGRARAETVVNANDRAQRGALSGVDPEILRRLALDLRAFLEAVEGPPAIHPVVDPLE